MKKQSRRIIYTTFALLLMIMFIAPSPSASAKSFSSGSSMYNTDKSNSNPKADEIEEEEPGFIEKSFASIIRSLGNGINILLGDMTIDSMIYGRIGYVENNFFGFELVSGNYYGVIGSQLYKILRSLVFAFIILAALKIFLTASWSSGNGKARSKFKSDLVNFIIVFLLLYLAPHIVDLIIYIKDMMLLSVQTISVADKGLIKEYRKTAVDEKTLISSIMYLSISCVQIYFMFAYVSTAIATMIMFGFFPLIAFMSFVDNKLITNWFKTLISNITIPIIDAGLLVVPMMMLKADNPKVPSIIILATMMAIIPSRGVIRNLLGLGSGGASEMLGLGALMAVGNLAAKTAKAGIGGAKSIADGASEYKENKEKSDMYSKLSVYDDGEPISRSSAPGISGSVAQPLDQDALHDQVALGNMTGEEALAEYKKHEYPEIEKQAKRNLLNYKNFDSKEMENVVTNADKAKFYKERANNELAKGIGRGVAAPIGAVSGGIIAGGATMMSNPLLMNKAISAGMDSGEALGNSTGEFLGDTHTQIDRNFNSLNTSFGQVNDEAQLNEASQEEAQSPINTMLANDGIGQVNDEAQLNEASQEEAQSTINTMLENDGVGQVLSQTTSSPNDLASKYFSANDISIASKNAESYRGTPEFGSKLNDKIMKIGIPEVASEEYSSLDDAGRTEYDDQMAVFKNKVVLEAAKIQSKQYHDNLKQCTPIAEMQGPQLVQIAEQYREQLTPNNMKTGGNGVQNPNVDLTKFEQEILTMIDSVNGAQI